MTSSLYQNKFKKNPVKINNEPNALEPKGDNGVVDINVSSDVSLLDPLDPCIKNKEVNFCNRGTL